MCSSSYTFNDTHLNARNFRQHFQIPRLKISTIFDDNNEIGISRENAANHPYWKSMH